MGPYADPSDPSSKYAQATFTLFHPLRRTLILHAESPEKRYRVLLHLVVCAHSHSFFSLSLFYIYSASREEWMQALTQMMDAMAKRRQLKLSVYNALKDLFSPVVKSSS